MRVFSRELGKYCTVVSTTQLKDAKASGIRDAKIQVETYMNIYGQGEKPFFRRLDVTEVLYHELKF